LHSPETIAIWHTAAGQAFNILGLGDLIKASPRGLPLAVCEFGSDGRASF
jgi:hypothetical protein